MDLAFSQEQIMLRDMVRKLCRDFAPLTVLREVEGTEPGFSALFWQQLGELGLTGITIPESHGGLQMGALESSIIAEEFGRALAVSPHHVSSILAAELIAQTGNEAQRQQWLRFIASGNGYVTVASSEPGMRHSRAGICSRVGRQGTAIVLEGTKHLVPFAADSDAILVLARDESSRILALLLPRELLESSASAASLRYQENHARDPLYELQFTSFTVPAELLLNAGDCVWSQWEDSLTASLIPLAAYAVGAAERVHEISVEYAKYRKAFGRPIGGFQAIAHYLAEIAVAIEGTRTLVYQAAWARDEGRSYRQLAMMAKLQACETFRRAAAVAIQVHGGIGYTMEADPQLFFRRAKQLQSLHWDPASLEQRIGEQLFARSA